MRSRTRGCLSYANVVSSLALFFALAGGTAYAVNEWTGTNIVDESLTTFDLKDDGVLSQDIRNDNLTAGGLRSVDIANAQSGSDAVNANRLDGKDSSEFAPAGSESFQPPTLNNGNGFGPARGFVPGDFCFWSNFGFDFSVAAFFRDPAGVVHLKGLVDADDGEHFACDFALREVDRRIFTLPAGYRPDERLIFPVISNNKLGRVDISPDGTVEAWPGFDEVDARSYVSLEEISFRCAPAGTDGCPPTVD